MKERSTMNSSTTLQIGKTRFLLIEDYLPVYNEEAETQTNKIKHIFRTSQPIPIPLNRNPSFTSIDGNSDSSPFSKSSPTVTPICYLYIRAKARDGKPNKDTIRCSKKIIS